MRNWHMISKHFFEQTCEMVFLPTPIEEYDYLKHNNCNQVHLISFIISTACEKAT